MEYDLTLFEKGLEELGIALSQEQKKQFITLSANCKESFIMIFAIHYCTKPFCCFCFSRSMLSRLENTHPQ